MRRHTLVITLGFVILSIAWYLFRPELLLIDKPVNEQFPGGTQTQITSQDTSPVMLLEGRFHGVAHEGEGVATVYQLQSSQRILRLTDFKTVNGPALYAICLPPMMPTAMQPWSEPALFRLAGLKAMWVIRTTISPRMSTLPNTGPSQSGAAGSASTSPPHH